MLGCNMTQLSRKQTMQTANQPSFSDHPIFTDWLGWEPTQSQVETDTYQAFFEIETTHDLGKYLLAIIEREDHQTNASDNLYDLSDTESRTNQFEETHSEHWWTGGRHGTH